MVDTEIRQSKILVVDDEPRNVRLLEVRLKAEGYEIITAANGDEALEKTFAETPDLILLDIMMPGKDGWEVCEELRATASTRFVPIIMITALDEREHKIKGLKAGADDFIVKPPDPIELGVRVRSLLRIKHFQDDLARLNRELELRNEIMEQDLLMAREVQQQLLPHDVSDIPGFGIVYKYMPESQVGGDFVEITSLSEDRIGVFLADAMGHGAQAALITVLLKTALNELLEITQEPESILAGLNQRFVSVLSGEIVTYASGCYVIADRKQKKLWYSNAGHPFPLLLNRQTGECVELDGAGTGTGIGLLPSADYVTADRPFDEEQALLLLTDGLYEAMNGEGYMYGVEQVRRQLMDRSDQQLSALVSSLLTDVGSFVGEVPLPDDITLVGLELG